MRDARWGAPRGAGGTEQVRRGAIDARATIALLALVVAIAAACAAVAASPASAARPFDFGFADDRNADNLFTNSDPAVRQKWFARATAAGARYARINVYWSSVAPRKPANPTDPADPAYNWTEIDNAVTSARQQNLEVILLALNAPTWAEGANKPKNIRGGVYKPDPGAFKQFATALAKRYSGTYVDPDDPPIGGGGGCGLPICPPAASSAATGGQAAPAKQAGPVLPRVTLYEAWNEPNLDNYIYPQWNGKSPASPEIYRNLLNGFYDGVKSVSSANQVIVGGTSPFGTPPGGSRMSPLFFWRQVFCLSNKLKKTAGCTGSSQPRFDIFAHNAINSPGDTPDIHASNPDDATPADMGDLRKVLKAAEKRGTVLGRTHGFWSTETWYESSPPERAKNKALPLKAQAQAMADAMYILWKQGATNVIWLQLRDSPYNPKNPALVGFQTGIYFLNEKPKPSVKALRFPFVVDVKGKRGPKAVFWGIAPADGQVKVQLKKGGYRTVAKKRVSGGEVFKLKGRLRGKGSKLRATMGSQKSLTVKKFL